MTNLPPLDQNEPITIGHDEPLIIPVTEEQVEIKRRRYVAGKVRLRKSVHRSTVQIDEPGYAQRVEVRHVPINEYVISAPEVRYEGDTMIIPVVQEVIVVERRLMLREEVHVTRHTVPVHRPVEVELRREEVSVERIDESESPNSLREAKSG